MELNFRCRIITQRNGLTDFRSFFYAVIEFVIFVIKIELQSCLHNLIAFFHIGICFSLNVNKDHIKFSQKIPVNLKTHSIFPYSKFKSLATKYIDLT